MLQVGVWSQLLGDFVAVEPWQADVKQDNVRAILDRSLNGL
jgi:hypothetical protein